MRGGAGVAAGGGDGSQSTTCAPDAGGRERCAGAGGAVPLRGAAGAGIYSPGTGGKTAPGPGDPTVICGGRAAAGRRALSTAPGGHGQFVCDPAWGMGW